MGGDRQGDLWEGGTTYRMTESIGVREGKIHHAGQIRKAAGQRARILAALEIQLGGSTAREIGAALGIDGAWKRMAELAGQRLAHPGEKRKCRITGQKARTWMLGGVKAHGDG